MLITSVDNKNIKEIRKLKEKKYSLSSGLCIIEGDHLVKEAIKDKLLCKLYLLDGNNDSYDFEYDIVTASVMKSISDMKSLPRVIGVCKIPESKPIGKKIVILDEIQDPGNMGTIIRSCVAFGVDTLVVSNNSVNPYNIKTIRSAEGMIFKLNIIIGNIEEIINEIKEKNIPVIGTSLHTDKYVNQMNYSEYAVVFGNEGGGIKEKILSLCDEVYKIKMNDECESLNVGVSAGIILSKLY